MTGSNLGTGLAAAIAIEREEAVTTEADTEETEVSEETSSSLTCVEMRGEQVVHLLSSSNSSSSSKAETTSSITADKTVNQSRS
jgi:hypothetical protein